MPAQRAEAEHQADCTELRPQASYCRLGCSTRHYPAPRGQHARQQLRQRSHSTRRSHHRRRGDAPAGEGGKSGASTLCRCTRTRWAVGAIVVLLIVAVGIGLGVGLPMVTRRAKGDHPELPPQ